MRALTAVSFLLLAARVQAADFDVSPTRLDLSANSRTGHLVVRNPGSKALRIQVSARGWQQALEGAVLLEDTSEVSFFPSLFELPAGASKNIRVGITGDEAATEKTFRVLIDELPDHSAGIEGGIQVITRLSVPVFFGKKGLKAEPQVTKPAMKAGAAQFSVKNVGAAHLMATKATVIGEDASGTKVASGEVAGWYVLAGGERRFSVEMKGDEGAVEKVARVKVRVETDVGPASADVRLP